MRVFLSRIPICGFAFLLLLGACSEAPQDGSRPLVVGMELASPPFEMRGPDNEPDGISVRMAEALAEHLGRPLEIRDTEWNGLIPSLKTGKIDLVISSMTKTPKREEGIDFSDGYVTNGLCLLVQKESAIQSIADIEPGKSKLAVKIGTTSYLWAQEYLPGVDLIILDDTVACVLEVIQGKVDAFVYDQISVYRFWKKYPEDTRPILDSIKEETWAIGLQKGNDDLREQVNGFLKKFRAEGGLETLADQYLAAEQAEFERLGVPFIFR